MVKSLCIPNEPRFVRALVLAVDRGNSLNFLLEIGALSSRDLGLVRRVREALEPAYELASERRDWDLVHATGILLAALAEPDHAAYLAYRAGVHRQVADEGANFAEALAVSGCAHEARRRPWEVEQEPDGFALGRWRGYTWQLLREAAIPGRALPKPPQPSPEPPPPALTCTCSEPGSPKALAGDHAAWCQAHHDEGLP